MAIVERRARALRAIVQVFAQPDSTERPQGMRRDRDETTIGTQAGHPPETLMMSPADEELLGRWSVQTLHGSGQAAYVPWEIDEAGVRSGIPQMDNENPSRYATRVSAFLRDAFARQNVTVVASLCDLPIPAALRDDEESQEAWDVVCGLADAVLDTPPEASAGGFLPPGAAGMADRIGFPLLEVEGLYPFARRSATWVRQYVATGKRPAS